MSVKNTFNKQERLCSKKQMDVLFGKGKSAVNYPIKLVYIETTYPLKFAAQAMFVVPKRSFKKAHDRNKLKRRMREAYRLNKSALYENLLSADKKLSMAFIFISKKEEDYLTIESSTKNLLSKAVLK